MNAHYPSDYPDGFEEKLIAAGAKTQTPGYDTIQKDESE